MDNPIEKKIGYNPKLTDEQRLICLRMYAEGETCGNISKYIKEEWNISYTATGISHLAHQKKYQTYLKKFKDDYLKRIKDVPIANKRVRVDDLEKVRIKVMKALEENFCETKGEREEFRHMVKTLNEVIANARAEMEKNPALIQNIGILGDFSDKSDDELIGEREELLNQARRFVPGAVVEVSGFIKGTEEPDL